MHVKDDAPTNPQSTDSFAGSETDLRSVEPVYDAGTDTVKAIAKGHPSAQAITNKKGVTVFFDPDTHEVLGYLIKEFSKYYEDNKQPDGSYDVDLPTRIPVNLEEEMDYDEEQLRSGVRIAEMY
jgi:hypothetical protein